MKLANKAIEGFLQNPFPNTCRALLVYGPDYGLAAERLKKAAHNLVDDLQDPFKVAHLDEAGLGREPDRLYEEAAQIPMLGGQKIVMIRQADSGTAKALERFLKDPVGSAIILMQAGDLRPDHRLRKLCETHEAALTMPCYLDGERDIARLIDQNFRQDQITIDGQARHYLIQHLGADHALSRSEIEKLALYAGKNGHLDLNAIQHALGDSAEFQTSDLINATLSGQWPTASRVLDQLFSIGITPIAMIRTLNTHLIRLQEIHSLMAQGLSSLEAVNSLTPKPFFKMVDHYQAQANHWSASDLNRALTYSLEAEADCKKNLQQPKLIVARLLMLLAARRRRKN